MRRVRDANYWHMPVGTPIEANLDTYVPGQWAPMPNEQRIADYLTTSGAIIRKYRPNISDKELWEEGLKAIQEQDQQNGGTSMVFANGPHRVAVRPRARINGWQDVSRVFALIDEMHARYPAQGSIYISITHPSGMVTKGSFGEALSGTGIIQLSDEAFDDRVGQRESTSVGHFMPAKGSSNWLQYVFVHEWGHVIDTSDRPGARGPGRMKLFRQVTDGASKYGQENEWEAHAEAFAEWYLTSGQTKNEFARAYADYFGW